MSEKLIVFFIFTLVILFSCNNTQSNDNDIADDDFIEDRCEEDNNYHDDENDHNSYCDPNPCPEVEWSDGSCIEKNDGFECGCSDMFIWNGTICEGKTREISCTGLPENTSWNSAEKITQKWTGKSWEPSEVGSFSMEESSTHCYFKCSDEYGWLRSIDDHRCTAGVGRSWVPEKCRQFVFHGSFGGWKYRSLEDPWEGHFRRIVVCPLRIVGPAQ